jgi:hypothetical protein
MKTGLLFLSVIYQILYTIPQQSSYQYSFMTKTFKQPVYMLVTGQRMYTLMICLRFNTPALQGFIPQSGDPLLWMQFIHFSLHNTQFITSFNLQSVVKEGIRFFFCSLFYGNLSTANYTEWSGWITNYKAFGRKWSWNTYGCHTHMCQYLIISVSKNNTYFWNTKCEILADVTDTPAYIWNCKNKTKWDHVNGSFIKTRLLTLDYGHIGQTMQRDILNNFPKHFTVLRRVWKCCM